MQVYIFDIKQNKYLTATIKTGNLKDMPAKKDGWHFNWRKEFKVRNTKTYVLKITDKTEGVIQLKELNGMLIMDLIEIAPHNAGKNKRFDFVAGCLIAFACRESIKLETNYRGFVSFVAKTKLIGWYKMKYGATQAIGQRMYIDDFQGQQLITEYLERTIK